MPPLFHGTSPAKARKILREGFDLDAERQSDPGDLGWGLYLTDSLPRAKSYGSGVLAVELNMSDFAHVENPYFLDGLEDTEPSTAEEHFFHDVAFRDGQMLSVVGDRQSREEVAKRIRDAFVWEGFKGIIAGPDIRGQHEVVVFDTDAILSTSVF